MGIDKRAIKAAIARQCAVAPGVRKATSVDLTTPTMPPEVWVEMVSSDSLEEHGTDGRGWGYEARSMTVQGYLIVPGPGDQGKAFAMAEPITDALFEASRDGLSLGLDYVQDCALVTAELGDIDIGDEVWYGALLTWQVRVREYGVARTADPVGWT